MSEAAPASLDAHAVGERIETLVAELSALEDARARAKVEELLRLLLDFYGEGLARMVSLARDAGAPLLDRFAEDGLVASLLVLHGLHPLDIETRVSRALDEVRPFLASHQGGVTLLGVDEDGEVRLRLEGCCDGCAASAETMKGAVERAVLAAAPEVTRIVVAGHLVPQARAATLPTYTECPVPAGR